MQGPNTLILTVPEAVRPGHNIALNLRVGEEGSTNEYGTEAFILKTNGELVLQGNGKGEAKAEHYIDCHIDTITYPLT
jgi:hypothetical protein